MSVTREQLQQPEALDVAARILSWQLDGATGTLGFHPERSALKEAVGNGVAIFTNHRGFAGDTPLDGGLDGWAWRAWSGSFIVHGATEEHATSRLVDQLTMELLPMHVAALYAAGERTGITRADIIQELWEDVRFGSPTLEEAEALMVHFESTGD